MANDAYQVFVALDATALEGGSIYLGQANADPELSPITVYWDAARSVVATQPLRTSGGVIVRDGTPANVYAAVDGYSIRVRDRAGEVVWYKPTTGGVAASRLTFPVPGGPAGDPGPTGPASAYRTTLAALKAANTSDGVSFFNGAQWVWTLGDYSALLAADTIGGMFVKSDANAANVGAWVRQYNGDINVRWFGAVGNSSTDCLAAFNAAKSVAAILGVNVYIPGASGEYYTSGTTDWGTVVCYGDGMYRTVIRPRSAADFTDGKVVFRGSWLRDSPHDFAILGRGLRMPTRSANQADMAFNGDGLEIYGPANNVDLRHIRVEYCRKGVIYNGDNGHCDQRQPFISNNWWGLWFERNGSDFTIDGGIVAGNQYADIGVNNVSAGATYPGGVSALRLRGTHHGFSPYAIRQEPGGNASVGMTDSDLSAARFESVGNRPISLTGTNSNGIRITAPGHSWDSGYAITGNAAHPVQDYAVVYNNIAGGAAGATMRVEGAGWMNGTTGQHTRFNGIIQHFITDTNGTQGYAAPTANAGIERIMDGSQPGGYDTQNTVARIAVGSAAAVTLTTFTRPARHTTAVFFTITGAVDYNAANAVVAQIKVNGETLQTLALPAGSGTFPVTLGAQKADMSLAVTIENASGLTLYNQSNSGRLTYQARYGSASV